MAQTVFGGNKGYVGYSKSRRAVRAEGEGMRSVSNFDADFVEEVNGILRSVGAGNITTAEAKRIAKETKADEWHHTSMYGNKTSYYAPETIAYAAMDETQREAYDERGYEEAAERQRQKQAEAEARRKAENARLEAEKEVAAEHSELVSVQDGYWLNLDGVHVKLDRHLNGMNRRYDEGVDKEAAKRAADEYLGGLRAEVEQKTQGRLDGQER